MYRPRRIGLRPCDVRCDRQRGGARGQMQECAARKFHWHPFPGTTIVARLMSQWLSERFGRPFVIDNRPGAATNIGTEAVVRAVPDGYTLLFVTSINASNAALYDNLNFNFIRDIAPVAN